MVRTDGYIQHKQSLTVFFFFEAWSRAWYGITQVFSTNITDEEQDMYLFLNDELLYIL